MNLDFKPTIVGLEGTGFKSLLIQTVKKLIEQIISHAESILECWGFRNEKFSTLNDHSD